MTIKRKISEDSTHSPETTDKSTSSFQIQPHPLLLEQNATLNSFQLCIDNPRKRGDGWWLQHQVWAKRNKLFEDKIHKTLQFDDLHFFIPTKKSKFKIDQVRIIARGFGAKAISDYLAPVVKVHPKIDCFEDGKGNYFLRTKERYLSRPKYGYEWWHNIEIYLRKKLYGMPTKKIRKNKIQLSPRIPPENDIPGLIFPLHVFPKQTVSTEIENTLTEAELLLAIMDEAMQKENMKKAADFDKALDENDIGKLREMWEREEIRQVLLSLNKQTILYLIEKVIIKIDDQDFMTQVIQFFNGVINLGNTPISQLSPQITCNFFSPSVQSSTDMEMQDKTMRLNYFG